MKYFLEVFLNVMLLAILWGILDSYRKHKAEGWTLWFCIKRAVILPAVVVVFGVVVVIEFLMGLKDRSKGSK